MTERHTTKDQVGEFDFCAFLDLAPADYNRLLPSASEAFEDLYDEMTEIDERGNHHWKELDDTRRDALLDKYLPKVFDKDGEPRTYVYGDIKFHEEGTPLDSLGLDGERVVHIYVNQRHVREWYAEIRPYDMPEEQVLEKIYWELSSHFGKHHPVVDDLEDCPPGYAYEYMDEWGEICLDGATEDVLAEFLHDNYSDLRHAVAEQGYGLDVLVNDPDGYVREAVAEQGYGLEILVNDPDWRIRETVAYQGFGLEILVNDENWRVRCAVADQGFGLDVLVNDEDKYVRRNVDEFLDEHGISLGEWIKANPDRCALPENRARAEEAEAETQAQAHRGPRP